MLSTNDGENELRPGIMARYPKGGPDPHRLPNRGATDTSYLDVGDRTRRNAVTYSDDDLVARTAPAGWTFVHEAGTQSAALGPSVADSNPVKRPTVVRERDDLLWLLLETSP